MAGAAGEAEVEVVVAEVVVAVAVVAEATTVGATRLQGRFPFQGEVMGREFARAGSRPFFLACGGLAAAFVFGLAIGCGKRSEHGEHCIEMGQARAKTVDEVA